MQFGAFAPVYRVHGTRGQEREPWNYGAKAEAVATEFIKLRYRLLPYIYSCAWETTRTGVSICRPLIYDYPDDPEAANLGTEWLFGDCFLVCPVLAEQAESVEVYLPVGDWIDYWTGERHQGPKKLSRRLDMETWEDMGLFVKSGAIIPTAPAMNYVGERPVTALTVDIYPGSRPSRFLYYDDDGETYDYERGVYMAVPFACAPTEGKVGFSIGKPEGTFEASLISYVLQFRLVGRPAGGVALNGQALEQKANPEQVLESKQAWTFTEGRDGGTLVVKVPARQESRIETDAGMGPRSGTRAPRSGR
jgi:alpha-glucosidase